MKSFKDYVTINEKDRKEDFSKIKPLIDEDINKVRRNLYEDSNTISRIWRTYKVYPDDVDSRKLKSLKEAEQLMDKARLILTKI